MNDQRTGTALRLAVDEGDPVLEAAFAAHDGAGPRVGALLGTALGATMVAAMLCARKSPWRRRTARPRRAMAR